MPDFNYHALRFVQRPGNQPTYMIAASAKEIVRWADAPHKKASLRAGYQRELDDTRLKNIKDFLLKSADNLMPSAALIAVREDCFSVQPDEEGATGGGDLVRIRISSMEMGSVEARAMVSAELRARLSGEELQSIGATAEDVDDGVESASALPEALEDEDEDEVDAPSGDVEEQEALADDAVAEVTPPESYLASLYRELLDYDALSHRRRLEIDEFVATMTNPGLIIDGQHRIFGAKEVDEANVILPVVVLPGLDVGEQVFNFYVLNNKARPLDKRQLRAIISTSLTKAEIEGLYGRFRTSGLNADAAQWTYRVNSDSLSPFRNLISLRLEDDTAPLDDNIMDQVVSRFIRMPGRFAALRKGVKWNDDPDYSRRLGKFYALWTAVRETYPTAWDKAATGTPGSQLFTKVALLQLQEFILEVLKQVVPFQEQSPFMDDEDLMSNVKTALKALPEDFFLREWKVKSLDTNERRKWFLSQMQDVAGVDGKYLGNFELFKSQSTSG